MEEIMSSTLYERLGGSQGIAALVDSIVEAHMANPLINARFLTYQDRPEKVAEIKRHTCNFLGSGTGGPEQYTGRSMPDTHRGMNISSAEYEAVADDIRAALIKHGIDPQTRGEPMAVVKSLKEQIVGI